MPCCVPALCLGAIDTAANKRSSNHHEAYFLTMKTNTGQVTICEIETFLERSTSHCGGIKKGT